VAPEDVVLSPFDSRDHPGVVALITTIQQHEFRVPLTLADQPDLMDIPGFYDLFLVARSGTTVVGTAGIKKVGSWAVLRKMFVDPAFRGKPFRTGQKLLEQTETWAKKEKTAQIWLETGPGFKAALRFYEKNGYVATAEEDLPPDFPRVVHGSCVLFYTKTLS
jgi:GNAT superfamily N-acetyltransferase